MRGIWTIYLIAVFASFAILETRALLVGEMPLTGWVRAVTVHNPKVSIAIFLAVSVATAMHFWVFVKPRL